MKPMKYLRTQQKIAVFLVFFIMLFALQISQSFSGLVSAQTNNTQWAINLQIQKNGQAASTFSPFDLIQVSANITYGGASASDILVTFNIQNPSTTNSVNVTRIVATNASGIALFSMRLPMETPSANSSWQALAIIKTPDGPLQKSLSFNVKWLMQISSIVLSDSQGQSQTTFKPNDVVDAALTIDNAGQAQDTNITFEMQDSAGQLINQTTIQNQNIQTNSTMLNANIQVPGNATAGSAALTVEVFSGTYDDVGIPVAEYQTASFIIAAANATEPAVTATPSPTVSPTSTPTPFENTISLFAWILLVTGLFTFTVLFVFLKRKPSNLEVSMPKLPLAIRGQISKQ